MNEDIDVYLDASSGTCYLESLAKTLTLLYNKVEDDVLSDLIDVIKLEIELASIGSRKALAEVKPATDNVIPIK